MDVIGAPDRGPSAARRLWQTGRCRSLQLTCLLSVWIVLCIVCERSVRADANEAKTGDAGQSASTVAEIKLPQLDVTGLLVSNDGKRAIWSGFDEDESVRSYRVFAIDLRSGSVTDVSKTLPGVQELPWVDTALSDDGRRLAIVAAKESGDGGRKSDEKASVFVVDLDTGKAKDVYDGSVAVPVWIGARLCLTPMFRKSMLGPIVLVDLETGEKREIGLTGLCCGAGPSREKLVVALAPEEADGKEADSARRGRAYRIVLADQKGQVAQELVKAERVRAFVPVIVSPRGTHLAFRWGRDELAYGRDIIRIQSLSDGKSSDVPVAATPLTVSDSGIVGGRVINHGGTSSIVFLSAKGGKLMTIAGGTHAVITADRAFYVRDMNDPVLRSISLDELRARESDRPHLRGHDPSLPRLPLPWE